MFSVRRSGGQVTLEFLMTYGWAILIIMVVIAILFYLGVFTPTQYAPSTCQLPTGLSCFAYKISGSGILTLDLAQATGRQIRVTGIACTQEETPSVWTYSDVSIRSGGRKTFTLPCYDENGQPVTEEFYRGRLFINYTDIDTGIEYKVKGDIAARLEGFMPGLTRCNTDQDCLTGSPGYGQCNMTTHNCINTCGDRECNYGETSSSCPDDCPSEMPGPSEQIPSPTQANLSS